MTEATPSLGARAASGMVWLASQTVAARLITIVSQWILANFLLGPEQFGQIGLVYTITVLATQLTNPGVDDVLLQRQNRIRRWVNPAFWISLSCALAGAVVMSIAGGVVVLIAQSRGNLAYGNPDVFFMTLILASGAPLNAAAQAPAVMLRSQMRFARLAAVNLGEAVSQQALMLVFAALGFGAFSFVIPMPLVAAVRLVALWILVRPPVRMHLGLHRWPALVGSTGWVFGQRMLNTIVSQGDRIVLGAIFADEKLVGLYFYAFTLSMQIVRVLCDNLAAVILPVLASIKDDPQRLAQAAARSSKALASLVIPIAALQILLAGPAVRVLFIREWEPIVLLIRLLGFGLLSVAPAYPLTAMITAAGRFRANFFLFLFNLIVYFAIVIPLSLMWKAPGTAAGTSLWNWCSVAAAAAVAYRSTAGIAVLFAAIWRSLLAAIISISPIAALMMSLTTTKTADIVYLFITPPTVLGIYYLGLRTLDHKALIELSHDLGGALQGVLGRLLHTAKSA